MIRKKQKIVPLTLDTYLAVIKNSIGSKTFRNLYCRLNGKKSDITKNGKLSCAFYVSSILALFKLIEEIHATVDSTVKDLKKSGWKEIKKPKIGSILVWEKMNFIDHDVHKHIGFYVDKDMAVSNNYKLGYPIKHRWTFDNKRKIEMILWNLKLK